MIRIIVKDAEIKNKTKPYFHNSRLFLGASTRTTLIGSLIQKQAQKTVAYNYSWKNQASLPIINQLRPQEHRDRLLIAETGIYRQNS